MAQGSAGNVIAALASFFIPGLGQLVQGRLVAAAVFFITAVLFYALVVTWPIALIIHIWSIVNAALFKSKE
ncbi:MAG: hypothetical protein ACLUKN_16840 [Bacilli bacterium]